MSVEAAEADRSYLGLCCVYFHFRDTTQVARSLYTYLHIFGCNNLNIDQLPNVQIIQFMSYQSQAKYIQ